MATIVVKIRCVDSVFGVDPLSLDQAMDVNSGLKIPAILVLMKDSLLKYDALSKEGIFRLAGETTNVS
jgi:hypothetical protein